MEFDPKVVARLQAIPGNRKCADCGSAEAEWASINIGVTVCVKCSGAHRSLGTHISQVRSLKLDNWSEDMLAKMEKEGNDRVNALYENYVPSFFPKPSEYPESDALRKRFVKAKYETKSFVKLVDEDEEKRKILPKEGYLLKLSKNDANKWQKRWLVLSEGALAYYKSSDSATPKGVIRLGGTVIYNLPSVHEITVAEGLGAREYHFRSTSPDEIIDWLIALRAAMCENGRGSLVRRALGSTLEMEMSEDVTDEKIPGSDELLKEAYRVISEGHSLRQGWLFKRSTVGLVTRWSKRYFVLLPEGVLYYFKTRLASDGKWKDPMGAASIVGASVEMDTQKPYGIAVRCPESQILLGADSEDDRESWISALKSAADAHLSPAN